MKKIQSKKTTFFIETYGCQMNKNDTELISAILFKNGFIQSSNPENSDIIMINTCSVREHAEIRAIGRINALSGLKKKFPEKKLGIIGCMAQRLGQDLLKSNPSIDFIVGPDEYRKLPEIIKYSNNKPLVTTEFHPDETYESILPAKNNRISSYVTITRGCNNFCSYCIVPYTRGRERSRNRKNIIEEIKHTLNTGKQEIILLGQNVNSYFDGKYNFSDLLRKICRIREIKRIRFMTSHPKDLTDDILYAMRDEDKICPHLHLPVQSGSTRILSLMNRKYTREDYIKLTEKAKSLIPGISITTDIMTGFPGETEQDFQDSIDLMKTVYFDNAYLYKFSPRTGTKAAEMKNQIPEKEKLERLSLIINIQKEISLQKKKNMIGQIVEVMPESLSKNSEMELRGKTQTNFDVIIPKDGISLGQLVKIKLDECKGATLRGKINI